MKFSQISFGFRHRLIIGFSSIILLFLSILIVFELTGIPFTEHKGNLIRFRNGVLNDMELVSALICIQIRSWVTEQRHTLELLASELSSDPSLYRTTNESQALTEKLTKFKSIHDEFESIALIDPYNATIRGASGVFYKKLSASDLLIDSAKLARLRIPGYTETIYTQASDDTIIRIRFTHQIFSTDSLAALTGILLTEININKTLKPLLSAIGRTITRDWVCILANNTNHNITDLSPVLSEEQSGNTIIGDINQFKPIQLALNGMNGSYDGTDEHGQRTLAFYRQLKIDHDVTWALVLRMEHALALQPFWISLRNQLFIWCVMLCVGISLCIIVARQISKPIQTLINAAHRIESGDSSARAKVDSSSEIGVLALVFNTMVTRLQQWQQMLEHQIQERTAELRESERKWQFAIEGAGDGLWDWNRETNKVVFSSHWKALFGYADDQFGDDYEAWRSHVHPDDLEKTLHTLEKHLQNQTEVFHCEYRLRCSDGTYKWTLARGKILDRSKNVSPLRMIGTNSDISERKKDQELLASERERLSVTLRSIGDGVITTDTEGVVSMLNKAAEELTGWKSSEAVGKLLSHVFVIIHEESRAPLENPVEKVLSTKGVIELANHTCLITKDGKERVIADSGAPIFDNSGQIIGVVLVFRDITEKQKLIDYQVKAQKLESIGVLAGGIAHDFNNLLAGVFGFLDVANSSLGEGNYTETSQALLKAIAVYDRAKALTMQLLTFSKGGVPIRKTMLLNPLIKSSTRFALSGSNITSQFSLSEDLWLCDCDENQIGQVIDNIVINAKQAMPMGGNLLVTSHNVIFKSKPKKATTTDKYIKISIKDHGIGMPKDLIPHIFDPFFSTKESGHGLGLATVFSIIQQHDGWIEVESEPGKGSTFHLFLPKSDKIKELESKKTSLIHQGGGTILLMDDEKCIVDVMSVMLQKLGYTVVTASNGQEALRLFTLAEESGNSFAASILDLTIPGGKGGKETVVEIKKIKPDAVVVASSGYSVDPIMSNPCKHGFTDSITKPFMKKDVVLLLNRLFAKAEEPIQ